MDRRRGLSPNVMTMIDKATYLQMQRQAERILQAHLNFVIFFSVILICGENTVKTEVIQEIAGYSIIES